MHKGKSLQTVKRSVEFVVCNNPGIYSVKTGMENTVLGIGSRVKHPAFGLGVIIRLHQAAYDVCFVQHGIKSVGKHYNAWEIIEAIPPDEQVSFSDFEERLAKVLHAWSDISEVVPLADRWDGGKLIIASADGSVKPKEIPIDTFFHKIVMVRDRIRVMEQRINAHKKLSESDKVDLQQYITRMYGSLTTFNILFKYKEHHFVGERSRALQ